MTGALLYLLLCTARNRVLRQLRRVREPRYAVALLVGLGYLWLVLLRRGRPDPLAGAATGDSALLASSVGLALLVASWWLFSGDRSALTFTPAEVQFLFPAPVSRRKLIEYKLLHAQLVIVVSSVIWIALLVRGAAGSLWLRGISLWVLFSTLHLHRVGAALVRASAREQGVTGLRRNAVPLLIVSAALVATAWSMIDALPALRTALAGGNVVRAIGDVLRGPVMSVVLAPFRLVVAPTFSQTSAEWLRAIVPALVIMLAHYPWVLRSDTAFEEGAAEAAAKRADRLGRAAAGAARRAPLAPRSAVGGVVRLRIPLAPRGRPAVALLWKNVLSFVRTVSLATLIVIAVLAMSALAFVASAFPEVESASQFVAIAAITFAGLLVVLGPLWIRNDLRQDLLKLEMLRSYPLSGAEVVSAEVAGSALTLTAIQFVLVAVAFVALLGEGAGDLSLSDRVAIFVAVALALPAVNAVEISIQNAATLLFPAWVRLGDMRPSGVEAIGQSLLTTTATLALGALILAVPAGLGVGVSALLFPALGMWALLPGVIVGVGAVVAELSMIVRWLGRVLERTEPVLQ
jgi:ABC-2 type transport system permease protein